jgi:hypothetical protein
MFEEAKVRQSSGSLDEHGSYGNLGAPWWVVPAADLAVVLSDNSDLTKDTRKGFAFRVAYSAAHSKSTRDHGSTMLRLSRRNSGALLSTKALPMLPRVPQDAIQRKTTLCA